jgi:hypothetical protein
MNIPDKLIHKIQGLAKEVAKNKMAASISIAEDEGEEDEDIDIDEDHYEEDLEEEDDGHDSVLLSAISSLLSSWDIRDNSSDAGMYYNELKQLYKENKDVI